MSKRSSRVSSAKETVDILERGFYQNKRGQRIDVAAAFVEARAQSILYRPAGFSEIYARREELLRERKRVETQFEVRNETTLEAANRLVNEQGLNKVLCLNFASAKNPGGGFLNGAQAQEESLARASGLFPCIAQMREMYDTNRGNPSCLYTDYMIYSPRVPVFKNDDNELLDAPYEVSFLTAPAVNAGVVIQQGNAEEIAQIESTMISRIEKVLSVAVVNGYRVLVLGAWGCGVFRNDPAKIAHYFKKQLVENPIFKDAFDKVVFAVLDSSKDEKAVQPFRELFG